jgi:hypothetical protein
VQTGVTIGDDGPDMADSESALVAKLCVGSGNSGGEEDNSDGALVKLLLSDALDVVRDNGRKPL